MTSKIEKMGTKVITGKVRFSYANVFVPKAQEEGQAPKYSVSLIIPKSDTNTVNAIKQAINEALTEGKSSKFGGKLPKTYKNPLRDGDLERDGEEYKNSWFVNASSTTKPGIVDADRNDIIDKEAFYSGCYGRASINFYAFNKAGNMGVACGLNNLQFLHDGDRLGAAKTSAQDDFGSDESDLF